MTAPDISAVPRLTNEEKFDRKVELDVEDSCYLLHALESEAFSCVVKAMRAQGMLTEYKQVLLDHLKTALFVSDTTYKAEMRHAANDEVLCKIAETLNPSYDSFVQWGLAANDVIPPAFNQIPLYTDQDIEGLDVAGQLLRLANSHNSAVDSYNDALHELITLPKVPFVPEKLRALLKETETDANDRLDVNFDESISGLNSGIKKNSIVNEKRGRKIRNSQKIIKEEKSGIRLVDGAVKMDCASNRATNCLPTEVRRLPSENVDEQKLLIIDKGVEKTEENSESSCFVTKLGNAEIQNEQESSFVLPIVATSTVSQKSAARKAVEKLERKKTVEEKETIVFGEEGKAKRKKSKQRDNVKDTCARVRPFLFESGSPGQAKPPRGNPDKRTAKRSSPTFSYSPSTTGISSGAVFCSQSYTTPVSSRGAVFSSVSPNISRFTTSQSTYTPGIVIKRMRTSSTGEVNTAHSGYYGRIADGNVTTKVAQFSERPYSRVFIPPSQAAAAWSNPARPYYGNPSAAAMGVNGRSSSSLTNSSNSMCASNTSGDKVLIPQQTSGQLNDSDQVFKRHYSSSPVFVAVGHQQTKGSVRRSVRSSKSVNSTSNTVSVRLSPLSVGSGQGVHLKGPGSPGEQFEGPCRSNSFSASRSSSASVSSLPSRCTGYVSPTYGQNIVISRSGCSLSHPNESFVQNSFVTQGGRQGVLADKDGSNVDVTTKDDTSNSGKSDDCTSAQELRLECDEVMAPEQRCVISPRSPRSTSPLPVQIKHVMRTGVIPSRVSQQLSVILSYDESNEMHLNRVVQPQFMNGLLHQDEQEIVGLITSEQCIR